MITLVLFISLICFNTKEEFLTDKDSPIRVAQNDKNEVKLIYELSRQKVFVNEPLIISYKLLFTGTITDVGIVTEPVFDNMTSDELNFPRNVRVEYLKGKEYKSYTLKRFIVTPHITGSVTINPLSIKLKSELPPDPNDFFASERFEDITISSAKQELQVQPLPLAGYSNIFSGAVGEFKIKSSIVQDTISAGSVLNLDITIQGKGSIINMRPPTLNFPKHFEIYPPTIERETLQDISGYTHSVKFRYDIIIENAGKFELPSILFNYFDPTKGNFVTRYTDPKYVYIAENTKDLANANNPTNSNVQGHSREIGSLTLMNESTLPVTSKRAFFNTPVYYALTILQLLVIALSIAYSHYIQTSSWLKRVQNEKAYAVAVKKLKQLTFELGDSSNTNFYNRVHQIVNTYLSERFAIPKHLLTNKSIKSNLHLHLIPDEQIDELLLFLKECDEIIYSECSINLNKRHSVDAIKRVLRELEKSAT